MRTYDCDVVVVGGGSTGAGVVRDVAMRGFRAILVDRADLGQGTTGRYHGLLHSGGRYVVSDPLSAMECAEENAIVKRIHAAAVEKTGGLFVSTPADDLAFSDDFLAGCVDAGVPVEEISVATALKREPRLNPGIRRAFEVPDAAVDSWQLVWGAARSAQAYGARILTYHEVTGVDTSGGSVRAVECVDRRTGEQVRIGCGFLINAAGAWSGEVAALAGCHDVDVVPGRGIMIAMNHRLVNTVVNRCSYPSDGDILVPVHTVAIIGTTDVRAEDPDQLWIPRDEVQRMLDAGEVLVPGFRQARALHAWAGARPLVRDKRVPAEDTRHMSREMSIIDHLSRDGVRGLLTIVGGKLTTYRLMAEKVVDQMCRQLGEFRPCRTDQEPVPGSEDGHTYVITHRLAAREADRDRDQIICECELMSRGMLVDAMRADPLTSLDDLRRQLRLGMGPCQGGFCTLRTVGIGCAERIFDASTANLQLTAFRGHRWAGLWPILYGDQVRQTALDEWIYQGLLDVEHLPASEARLEAVPLGVGRPAGVSPGAETGTSSPSSEAGAGQEAGR